MYFDMPKMSSENFENRKFIHSLIWLSNCIILDIFHYFSFIGRRPKFVRAEHSATAKGEKCGYGPTLKKSLQEDLDETCSLVQTVCFYA